MLYLLLVETGKTMEVEMIFMFCIVQILIPHIAFSFVYVQFFQRFKENFGWAPKFAPVAELGLYDTFCAAWLLNSLEIKRLVLLLSK